MKNAFDRVIGYEKIKEELMQVCDMMQNKEIYARMGAKCPRGILLFGVPGVGKSMMAETFLQVCGMKAYILRHNRADGDFIDEIRRTFEEAADNAPAVILLDDMDKFAAEEKSNEELVAVQACIDTVKDKEVLVIATANALGDVPESLLRAGRFDRKIRMECPRGEDTVQIIKHYMEKKTFVKDANHEDISKMLYGSSCAELETVLNEAAIQAAFERKECIYMEHLVKATLRKTYGLQNNCERLSPEKREEIAYHEAGHAVIADVLDPDSVGLLSLAAEQGCIGGFMLRCKEYERRAHRILVAFGGKAAAELQFGKIASGTYGDLDGVGRDLWAAMAETGTTGMGLLDVTPIRLSDSGAFARETAMQAELERYLFKAKEILAQNRDYLHAVAKALLEKETLLHSELRAIRESVTVTPATVG